MSAPASRRFTVRILLGRELSRNHIEAADQDTAIAIAKFLYTEIGDTYFTRHSEDVIDMLAEEEDAS